MTLRSAPDSVHGPDGRPSHGVWAGEILRPHRPIRSPLSALFVTKRWQYFAAFGETVAVGGAIVNAGYAANAFLWVFDVERSRLVADESRVLPGVAARVAPTPADGVVARFRGLTDRLTIDRDADRWTVRGRLGSCRVDLTLVSGVLSPITAVCPTTRDLPDAYNVTRKQVGLRADGELSIGARRWNVTTGVGLLDHSHGALPRETRWQWATGCARRGEYGFNLVAGFNDGLENVVWLDDSVHRVGAVRFHYTRGAPQRPWRVESDDGSVDLSLEPQAVRSQDLDVLGIIRSRYAQPIGTWRGRLLDRVVELPGVAEDHLSLW